MKTITNKIPKALIKIPSRRNKPILQINLEHLIRLGLKDIFLVTGHLGHLINDFTVSFDQKIAIIHSKEEYKKGPLNSLLEAVNSQKFRNNLDQIYEETFILVMPGDTVFELNLLRQIHEYIIKKALDCINNPMIFYRSINKRFFFTSQDKNDHLTGAKKISIAILEQESPLNYLKKISHVDLERTCSEDTIKQIIPLFIFPGTFIEKIIEFESSLKERTIKALINAAIIKGEKMKSIGLLSEYNFHDIDNEDDIKRLI